MNREKPRKLLLEKAQIIGHITLFFHYIGEGPLTRRNVNLVTISNGGYWFYVGFNLQNMDI